MEEREREIDMGEEEGGGEWKDVEDRGRESDMGEEEGW